MKNIELRDYLAGQAVAGMMAWPGEPGAGCWHNNSTTEDIAERAYEIADAMMDARKKNARFIKREPTGAGL